MEKAFVVVRLDDDAVRVLHPFPNKPGHKTQIGGYSNLHSVTQNLKANRVNRVVKHGERIDGYVGDGERVSIGEEAKSVRK